MFCASLADVFDNQAPVGAREDLFELIRNTPNLDWLVLTKRPENFAKMLPDDFGASAWPNVWLGVSAEDQMAYERRWPLLAGIDCTVRFISYEPAIGPLTIEGYGSYPDWLICGGESGQGARPMEAQWARDVLVECRNQGIPYFLKQWGRYQNNPLVAERKHQIAIAKFYDPPANGKGGAELNGLLHREFPNEGLA